MLENILGFFSAKSKNVFTMNMKILSQHSTHIWKIITPDHRSNLLAGGLLSAGLGRVERPPGRQDCPWARWGVQKLKIFCLYNELAGSGLGQFGLTAVKTLQMKHLIMSDFHHNVINALDFHLRLNLTDTGRAGIITGSLNWLRSAVWGIVQRSH